MCALIAVAVSTSAQNLKTVDKKSVSINNIITNDKPTVIITFAFWNKPGWRFINEVAEYYKSIPHSSVNVVAIAVDNRPISASSFNQCKDWPFETYACEDYSIIDYLSEKLGRKREEMYVNMVFRCKKNGNEIIVDRTELANLDNIDEFKAFFNINSPINNDYYDNVVCGEGFCIVMKNNKCGVTDENGKNRLPLQYDIVHYEHDCFIAKQNGKYGLFDRRGQRVCPLQYDSISPVLGKNDFLFYIMENNKWGVLNNQGKIVVLVQYDEIRFSGEYFEVEINKKHGILNKQGGIIIPVVYEDIVNPYTMRDGYFIVKKNGKYGCLNTQNRLIVDFEYNDLEYLGEDLFSAKKDKWGVIKKGKGKITQFNASSIVYSPLYSEKTVALLVDDTWIAVNVDGGCVIGGMTNKSNYKTEDIGVYLLVQAYKENWDAINCNEVDTASLLMHLYEYKGE